MEISHSDISFRPEQSRSRSDRTTWRYIEGDKYINLTFKNDELDSKDTNLGTQ